MRLAIGATAGEMWRSAKNRHYSAMSFTEIGDRVLREVRNADSRLHVARKERHHDEWDPPIEPYDPTGRTTTSTPSPIANDPKCSSRGAGDA
jgi:hypothetical protein